MHPTRLAERAEKAQQRILTAAVTLATHADMDAHVSALKNAWDRDPAVRNMLRAEALAALMEAVVERRTVVQATEKPMAANVRAREKAGV